MKACKISVEQITSQDHQGNRNAPLTADGNIVHAHFGIHHKEMCPCDFNIEWQDNQNSYSMKFDMGHIKELAIATSRKEVNIHLFQAPGCHKVGVNTPSSQFSYLDASKISSLQIVCSQEIPLDITRDVQKEFANKKAQSSRPRGKRGRDACGDCDCCVYFDVEITKRTKQVESLQKKYDGVEAQLKEVSITGMTADFEADFYTPVVYQHQILTSEISEIKKMIVHQPNLVPTRVMGMFDQAVLARANINEVRAAELLRDTLSDPMFGRKNHVKIALIRKKYGEEVLQDALRCMDELDTHNGSAGHPVILAWDDVKNREMTPPEMVVIVVEKWKQAEEEKEQLTRELSNVRIGRHAEVLDTHADANPKRSICTIM